MVFTIAIILRAITFRCVSAAQFTFCVPAATWHSEQSKPKELVITPMVPMKSSNGIPLSVLTLVKASSDIFGFVPGASWANATRANQRLAITLIARISVDQTRMLFRFSSLILFVAFRPKRNVRFQRNLAFPLPKTFKPLLQTVTRSGAVSAAWNLGLETLVRAPFGAEPAKLRT